MQPIENSYNKLKIFTRLCNHLKLILENTRDEKIRLQYDNNLLFNLKLYEISVYLYIN